MSTRCTRCGGPVIEIVIEGEASPLTMRSCSVCDEREWDSGGEPVEFDSVIGELTDRGARQRNKRSR